MAQRRTVSCPHCGSADRLATIEKVTGYLGCEIRVADDGKLEPDFDGDTSTTEFDWDQSETTGYRCQGCERDLTEAELLATVAAEPAASERPGQAGRAGSLAEALSRGGAGRAVKQEPPEV